MNPQELEYALMLRESGELCEAESKKLETYLHEHPEAADLQQEFRILQDAGRFASSETVPPLPELTRERIRAAAQAHPTRQFPKILALAAVAVLAVTLWPFFNPPAPSPTFIAEFPESDASPLPALDSFAEELDQLQQEIAAWSDTSSSELLMMEDEEYLAEQLLQLGESNS